VFESRHWFRELAATLGIFVVAAGVTSFFIFFPLSIPIAAGITILLIWLFHRKAVRHSTSLAT